MHRIRKYFSKKAGLCIRVSRFNPDLITCALDQNNIKKFKKIVFVLSLPLGCYSNLRYLYKAMENFFLSFQFFGRFCNNISIYCSLKNSK